MWVFLMISIFFINLYISLVEAEILFRSGELKTEINPVSV